MLPVHLETIRLFLHVVAATVWVGGQVVLAGLVPALRRVGPEATAAAARQFGRVAWPAFGVLLLTGVWNIAAATSDDRHRHGYQATLGTKMALVVLSGVAAFLHQRATTRRGLAVWGSVSGTAALLALFWGVILAG